METSSSRREERGRQMNIASQIEIAKTRLEAARKENNPTEIRVWESILKSLQELKKIKGA